MSSSVPGSMTVPRVASGAAGAVSGGLFSALGSHPRQRTQTNRRTNHTTPARSHLDFIFILRYSIFGTVTCLRKASGTPDVLELAIDVAGRLLSPVVPEILFQKLPDSGGVGVVHESLPVRAAGAIGIGPLHDTPVPAGAGVFARPLTPSGHEARPELAAIARYCSELDHVRFRPFPTPRPPCSREAERMRRLARRIGRPEATSLWRLVLRQAKADERARRG